MRMQSNYRAFPPLAPYDPVIPPRCSFSFPYPATYRLPRARLSFKVRIATSIFTLEREFLLAISRNGERNIVEKREAQTSLYSLSCDLPSNETLSFQWNATNFSTLKREISFHEIA